MPWQPKWEAAGYTVCTVRKQKEEGVVVQHASSFLMSGTHGMVLSTFKVGVHTSLNSVGELPHRYAQRFASEVILDHVKLAISTN